ncbi:MAG: hypothetical protein MZW92_60795 [Comamonadaceae bacterium]|nr:hypothetical protein [Comamonadaceae bacterium]
MDWFVCRGMVASEARSGATLRGVCAVMRAVADRFIQKTGADAGISEIVRRIDQSIQHGTPFMLYGQREDLTEYMPAGDAVIEEGAQAVKNAIGSGADIDVIVIGGGGRDALRRSVLAASFPSTRWCSSTTPRTPMCAACISSVRSWRAWRTVPWVRRSCMSDPLRITTVLHDREDADLIRDLHPWCASNGAGAFAYCCAWA